MEDNSLLIWGGGSMEDNSLAAQKDQGGGGMEDNSLAAPEEWGGGAVWRITAWPAWEEEDNMGYNRLQLI